MQATRELDEPIWPRNTYCNIWCEQAKTRDIDRKRRDSISMAKPGPGQSSKPAPAHHRTVQSPASPPSPKQPQKRAAGLKDSAGKSFLPVSKGDGVPDELQVIFGENLRAARLRCGLKQSELAERTGLTQQYLSLIEAGQQNVTLKTMGMLARVVDQHVGDMVRRVTDRPAKK